MTAEPEGPGWWMASDGRWYPPELHPAVLSGDLTADELRAVPLSGRADRTSIRWVAEADGASEGAVTADVLAAPEASRGAAGRTPNRTEDTIELLVAPGTGPEPEAATSTGPVLLTPPPTDANFLTGTDIDLGAPRSGPAAQSAVGGRVLGGVTAEGGSDYELPPERPSRFLLFGVAAAAIVLIAISALTFLRDGDGNDPVGGDGGSATATTAGPSEVTVSPVPVTLEDLAVGDCLLNPELEVSAVDEMSRADCAEPHTHEVFLTVVYASTGGAFDLAAMQAFPLQECQAGFEAFIGTPYVRSRYLLRALAPSRDNWADGERTIACLVYDPQGEVTGSLRGAES